MVYLLFMMMIVMIGKKRISRTVKGAGYMKHYLNVCDVNGAEVEPVDVITFGSPCQDLSVAGKRAGLKHESNGDDETTRSGLFMEAVRIIKEMRKEDEFRQLRSGRTNQHIRPRFAVWENVPGAFSSNKGEDFRVVLEELARIKEAEISIPMPEKGKWKQSGEIVGDGWSIAWRTLDAQYHGVPQRRRRIFLVADFAGECAGEILFECQGLPGYPSQSREKGQGTSGDSSESIGRTSERECIAFEPGLAKRDGSENRFVENCTPTIRANMGDNQTAVAYTLQIRSGCEGGGKGPLIQTDKSACLTAAQTQTLFQPFCIQGSVIGRKDENGPQGDGINSDKAFTLNTIDRHAVAYGICSYESNSMKSNNPHSGIYEADTARTLDLNGGNPTCNQDGICICEPIGFDYYNMNLTGNVGKTLQAEGGGTGVCEGCVLQPVAFRKTAHPRTADEGQGWEETTVNDTLNIFDSGETRTPTLVCEPISIENHPNDSRMGIREDGTVQTLTGRMGTGGGNVPLVAEPWTYQKVTGPLMANSHPGSYSGQNAYNDMFITEKKCYSIDDTKMANTYVWEEQANTLAARDYKGPQAVCYAIDRASFNQGENAQYDFQINDDEIAQTLVAKGPGAVSYYENIKYIVRRLTPTECARLQGMPDLWCRLSQIEDMSDEDYEFWKQAHKTYAEINGKNYKEKTKQQMITWYNKLQVDSAEYKAYGNGMALPCVRVPIHGIAKHGAKTMASLFDGIGGFPLAGLIDGIETLWTSEIELFPIAVTMERFREYEKYGCFTFGCDGRFE